jgi:hypothetical protein
MSQYFSQVAVSSSGSFIHSGITIFDLPLVVTIYLSKNAIRQVRLDQTQKILRPDIEALTPLSFRVDAPGVPCLSPPVITCSTASGGFGWTWPGLEFLKTGSKL